MRHKRALVLVGGVLILYAAIVAMLLRILPDMPTGTDYFVAGGVSDPGPVLVSRA
jgi:hypothetical protein